MVVGRTVCARVVVIALASGSAFVFLCLLRCMWLSNVLAYVFACVFRVCVCVYVCLYFGQIICISIICTSTACLN